MAWERRGKTGKWFYYDARRTLNGRVVKKYLGRGERASSAAAAIARSRAQQAADRQAVQKEQARLAVPDIQTAELGKVALLLMEAILLACGYHRQNYGKWRKKRHDEDEESN